MTGPCIIEMMHEPINAKNKNNQKRICLFAAFWLQKEAGEEELEWGEGVERGEE